jgi:phosphoglycerol geranylgeranyltransferase
MPADIGARVGRLGDVGRVLVRGVLDTNPVPREWDHVTKVDPEEAKKLPLLFPVWLQHTDAVSVGGSADVNAGNTETTFDFLAPLDLAVCHEPSGARHVTNGTRERAELMLIPEVLNGDSEALVGELGAAVEYVREEMAPELIARKAWWLPSPVADRLADLATSYMLSDAAFEAYIVQNPDSAAARESGVTPDDVLSPEEAKRRAMAADRHLSSEILYLEYSGTFGGEEALETLRQFDGSLTRSRIWYGGGLSNAENVRKVREAGADTVVVGDAFHRVADEEAALLDEAERTFDADTATEEIREFVADRVDADSAGPKFLSTVPGVGDATALAREYSTQTVEAWLDLRARATQTGSGGGPIVDLQRTTFKRHLAPVLDGAGDAGDDYAATLASAALSGRANGSESTDEGVHLSTSLLDE